MCWLVGETGLDQVHEINGLVGRKSEFAELRNALDDAANGRGRLLLISGEPGIGKTRLADEFSSVASACHAQVLWGRCWEGAGAPAYWPWIQAIKSIEGSQDLDSVLSALAGETYDLDHWSEDNREVVRGRESRHLRPVRTSKLSNIEKMSRGPASAVDLEQQRFRLFTLAADSFREAARIRPLALVLDDLHDADHASLQMLQFIARDLRDARVAIVGTYREVEVERSKALSLIMARIAREGIHLPLHGLAEPDVADFVTIRLGTKPAPKLVTMLRDATDGNPLFLEGVVRMLIAQGKLGNEKEVAASEFTLPKGVRIAIRRQIDSLSEPAQELLSIASVFGNEFDLRPLERVATPAEGVLARLEEAVAAGILIPVQGSPERYRFAHALIRSTIYEGTGAADRASLHQQIGEVFEDLYRADPVPHLDELAYHFRLGARLGDNRKAIDYSRGAAEAAEHAFAYDQSVTHLEAALNLTSSENSDALATRALLLSDLGRAYSLAGLGGPAVIGYADRAIAAYHTLGDVRREASVCAELGVQLAKQDDEQQIDIARARHELARAEEVFAPDGNGHALTWTRVGLSLASWQALDLDYGLTASDSVMESSGKHCNTWIMGAYFGAIHRAHRGEIAKAFEMMDESELVARRLDDSLQRFRTILHQGNLRLWTWQPREAMRRWIEGADELRVMPGSLQHRMLSWSSGLAAVQLANLDQARRFLEDGPRMLLEGQIAFYAGEWDQARDLLTRGADRMRQVGARAMLCDYLFWLSRVMRERGDLDRAEVLLREGAEIASSAGAELLEMLFLPELASLCITADRADLAVPHLQRCRDIVARGEGWFGLAGHLARAEGEYAASRGDLGSAKNHLDRAEEVFRNYSMAWEQARTLEALANAHTERERKIAHDKMGAALAIYRSGKAGQSWIDSRAASREYARDPLVPSRTPDVFRKQGDYWALAFGGVEFNLRDTKGMNYVARLLYRPGEQVAAIDLAAGEARSDSDARRATDLGDAGEVLDAKARENYQQRLNDLREEIERMRRMNDVGAIQRAEAEYDALIEHLTSAAGLGGRTRRTASHRERARVAVTKGIKSAIEHIAQSNPALGRHLHGSISTGHFCCYSPPELTSWQF